MENAKPYWFLLRDSEGRKSWHVTLGVPALIAASVWFLSGGLDLTIGKFHLALALKSGSDYLAFAGVWLTALGWRDTTLRWGAVTKDASPS